MFTPTGCDWPTVKLGHYLALLTGYPFKSARFTDNDHDMPLVRGANIMQGYLKWDGVKRWPNEEVKDFSNYLLEPGDVVLAMDRPWIEAGLKQACITKRDVPCLLVQRVARLRGRSGLLTSFLRYLIASPAFTDYIRPIVTGVNVPHISGSQIQAFTFKLPPLRTQRRIASILSAYDDLIENSSRRIEILEEMAQAIYREWFVHFRFPGHKKVRMVDSDLGPIPEGWEVKSLGEVCSYINRGIAPKYDHESESIVVNQKCIRNRRLNLSLARRHSKRVKPEKLIRFGDGLINSTGVGTLGRVTQVYTDTEKTTVDSHVTIVRPGDQVAVDYFGLALLSLQSHFEHMGQGATGQTELNRQSIAIAPLLVPDSSVQEAFSESVAPMRRNAVLLDIKNDNLRRTRDLLLPKLISGEVDVTQVTIDPEITEKSLS